MAWASLRRSISATAIAGLALAVSAAASGAVSCEMDIKRSYAAEYQGPEGAGVVVATTPAEWTRLWRILSSDRKAPEGWESLDAGEVAVAAHIGRRPNGMHRLELAGCQVVDGAMVVTIREAMTGVPTRAITTPHAVWVFADPGMPLTPRLVLERGFDAPR